VRDPRLGPEIIQWLGRVTGLPEDTFAGLSLADKLREITHWHASRVVAEQACLLMCALLMVEEGISASDLTKLLASKESKDTPLGAFSVVSGVCETPIVAETVALPLLECKAYRPFLRRDVGRAILALPQGEATPPAHVADALLTNALAPTSALKLLKTMRQLSKRDPQAMPRLLRALVELRKEATDVVVGQPDAEQVVEHMSGPQ